MACLSAAAPAQAGVLSEVVQGISDASDNDDAKPSHGAGDDEPSPPRSSGAWFDRSCCYVDPAATLGHAYGPPPAQGGMEEHFYLGMQSVRDSDGGFTLEGRVSFEDFGLGVRGTSYYEQVDRKEWVHLDLWWIGLQYRLDHDERGSVWVDVGLTGLNSNDQLDMTGAAVGLFLHRQLGGELASTAAVRRFSFEDDVAATELMVGLQVSILQISYRVMDFNVGPPLHGPEVGLSFRF